MTRYSTQERLNWRLARSDITQLINIKREILNWSLAS